MDSALHLIDAGGPPIGRLVQIVRDWDAVVPGEGRSVEGILRNGDENARGR